jgi:hypothetical protein
LPPCGSSSRVFSPGNFITALSAAFGVYNTVVLAGC